MGGQGSGRWNGHIKRETVENCVVIDINKWKREGHLRPGRFTSGVYVVPQGRWDITLDYESLCIEQPYQLFLYERLFPLWKFLKMTCLSVFQTHISEVKGTGGNVRYVKRKQ